MSNSAGNRLVKPRTKAETMRFAPNSSVTRMRFARSSSVIMIHEWLKLDGRQIESELTANSRSTLTGSVRKLTNNNGATPNGVRKTLASETSKTAQDDKKRMIDAFASRTINFERKLLKSLEKKLITGQSGIVGPVKSKSVEIVNRLSNHRLRIQQVPTDLDLRDLIETRTPGKVRIVAIIT